MRRAAPGLGLIAFGLIPLGLLALHGAGGAPTGATGIFAGDQLQYLSWVRELSGHLLARNNFDLASSSRVFADPVFGVSGLGVRAGLAPGMAYDLWLPVAAVALLAAYRAYVHRLVAGPGARTAALLLALFAASPLAPLVNGAGLSPAEHNRLAQAVVDATPALQLWGYFPIALALALVCVALLALERAVDPARRSDGRPVRREIALAAAAGGLAAWIHPWQGATLLLVLVALAGADRSRAAIRACGIAALGVGLPLAYYYVLPHLDHAWTVARTQNDGGLPWWVAPAAFAPLAAAALLGVRRPGAQLQERALVAWPAAALALFLLAPPYRIHALESVSLPLAILAVRGGMRFRVPVPLAVVLILAATEPGLIFAGSLARKAIVEHPSGYALAGDDVRALRAVRRSPVAGGVLTSTTLAAAVPAYTGRATWFGHPSWTPGFAAREREAGRFFRGAMTPGAARRFVRAVGARFVIAPCGSAPALARTLGARTVSAGVRFGCARVFTIR